MQSLERWLSVLALTPAVAYAWAWALRAMHADMTARVPDMQAGDWGWAWAPLTLLTILALRMRGPWLPRALPIVLIQGVLLAGTMLPRTFVRCHGQGKLTACKSILKNIGTALEMYSTDYCGHYPLSLSQLTPNYLKIIPTCPARAYDTYSCSYISHREPDRYTFYCSGINHVSAGISSNDYPQYNSSQGLVERP